MSAMAVRSRVRARTLSDADARTHIAFFLVLLASAIYYAVRRHRR
jgi:hypothetical protein